MIVRGTTELCSPGSLEVHQGLGALGRVLGPANKQVGLDKDPGDVLSPCGLPVIPGQ